MKQRLEQFLLAENLSKAQFADAINVARAGISHIIAGRNNPSYEFIVNTMKAFPDLNIEWLLCGKGSMYKSESHEPVGEISEQSVTPATVKDSLFDAIPAQKNSNKSNKQPVPGKRIIILYEDGSYEEFC